MQDYYLSRAHVLQYLAGVAGKGSDDATTLYLPFGFTVDEVRSRIGATGGLIPAGLAEAAQASTTGFCLFLGRAATLILPPLPITEMVVSRGLLTRPLEVMLATEKAVGLVLIRLGSYGVGVCLDERLVASKVGTGLVHARHRQGGSSAQRFRRHREKQIERFLIRVCAVVSEYIGGRAKSLDFIAYGGARTTVELLKKRCPVLRQFEDRELPPLFDITDPRQAVLEASARRIWASRILDWSDGEGGARAEAI
jgi:hypothetical protein